MESKKGVGLNALFPAVLAILLVGIALGIGVFILNETALATSTTAYSVVNQSYTATSLDDANGVALVGSSNCGSQQFAVVKVNNASNSTQIAYTVGNWTIDADSGRIRNISGDRMGTAWNISYTYVAADSNATTSSCRSLTTTSSGVGTLASWIAVIVVVLAASVVLGVVINSFAGGRKSGV